MEQKEIRLNSNKRKSLIIDNRRHWEEKDCQERQDFLESREKATGVIDSAFETMTNVVQRRFKPEHIFGDRSLTFYQKVYNTVDAVGTDSCFFMKVIDAPKVLDSYNDEVEKSKHFSWELDGDTGGDYGSGNYYSGSSNNGKNFAYAMYREEMKAV